MEEKKTFKLLVLEGTMSNDWQTIMKGYAINNRPIEVFQCKFEDLLVTNYENDIQISFKANEYHPKNITTYIDFALIRSVAQTINRYDMRNKLYTMYAHGLQTINSLESIILGSERLVKHGALKKIEQKLGHDKFPLIQQCQYSSWETIGFPPNAEELIVKVGPFDAGFGKMRFYEKQIRDIQSLMACTGHYCTIEPFIEYDIDYRLQKIGKDHYRAYQRLGSPYKGNEYWKINIMGGCIDIQEVPMKPEWKMWLDEVQTIFGGLDIFALDVLYEEKSDKYYILEVNDTAIGIPSFTSEEDNKFIRDIILARAQQSLQPKIKEISIDKQQLIDEVIIEKMNNQKMNLQNKELKELKQNNEGMIKNYENLLSSQKIKTKQMIIVFLAIIIILIAYLIQKAL